MAKIIHWLQQNFSSLLASLLVMFLLYTFPKIMLVILYAMILPVLICYIAHFFNKLMLLKDVEMFFKNEPIISLLLSLFFKGLFMIVYFLGIMVLMKLW